MSNVNRQRPACGVFGVNSVQADCGQDECSICAKCVSRVLHRAGTVSMNSEDDLAPTRPRSSCQATLTPDRLFASIRSILSTIWRLSATPSRRRREPWINSYISAVWPQVPTHGDRCHVYRAGSYCLSANLMMAANCLAVTGCTDRREPLDNRTMPSRARIGFRSSSGISFLNFRFSWISTMNQRGSS